MVNMKFLQRFPEYVNARKGVRKGGGVTDGGDTGATNPPQEVMEEAYQSMAAVLASELLEKIRASSPWFFQKIVKDLLIKMGYGGTAEDVDRSVTRGADEGIDGIINEDRLGLERVYIQAKRWADPVGRPEIQKFAGSLQGQQAHKGVLSPPRPSRKKRNNTRQRYQPKSFSLTVSSGTVDDRARGGHGHGQDLRGQTNRLGLFRRRLGG
jgi:restriction system protein